MTKKFILILFGLLSLADIHAQNTSSTTCKKCDKAIIETVTDNFNKVSISQIEQFFCSFDKKCNLTEKYKNSGGTYAEVAFETLVVELDLHLAECTTFLDKNKNIDFNYILSLLLDVVGHDLPYSNILEKLEKKKSRTTTEQKILDAIKQSVANYKKKQPTK